MDKIYLYATRTADQAFGFELALALKLGIGRQTPQEDAIQHLIDFYPPEKDFRLDQVGELFMVIGESKLRCMGRVRLDQEQGDPMYYNPRSNRQIRLKGEYKPELEKYIRKSNQGPRIVIAERKIGKEIERDLGVLVGDRLIATVYSD